MSRLVERNQRIARVRKLQYTWYVTLRYANAWKLRYHAVI